jgi:hypothetical protein
LKVIAGSCEIGEPAADVGVLERELDGRLQVSELVAAIEASSLERVRDHALLGAQQRCRGELDLPAGSDCTLRK